MIIIPDLFTPYMTGRETARQANWDDLLKYNQVQKGQHDNLFNFATFSPRVNAVYEGTDKLALDNMFNEQTFVPRVNAVYEGTNKLALDNLFSKQTFGDRANAVQAAANKALLEAAFTKDTYNDALTRSRIATGNAELNNRFLEYLMNGGLSSLYGVQSPTATPGVPGIPGIPTTPVQPTQPAVVGPVPSLTVTPPQRQPSTTTKVKNWFVDLWNNWFGDDTPQPAASVRGVYQP